MERKASRINSNSACDSRFAPGITGLCVMLWQLGGLSFPRVVVWRASDVIGCCGVKQSSRVRGKRPCPATDIVVHIHFSCFECLNVVNMRSSPIKNIFRW